MLSGAVTHELGFNVFFVKFLCHEGNNNGGITLFNIASGRFTKRNATWMFNEMQGIANSDYCFSECGLPYIEGDDWVCSTTQYKVKVLYSKCHCCLEC